MHRRLRRSQIVFLCFLAFISAIFLFAEYFHTEDTIDVFDNCPICQWERSIHAPGQFYVVCLLVSFLLITHVFMGTAVNKGKYTSKRGTSRAPPLS